MDKNFQRMLGRKLRQEYLPSDELPDAMQKALEALRSLGGDSSTAAGNASDDLGTGAPRSGHHATQSHESGETCKNR